MHGLLYRLRGIKSWPETQASVTQVDELSRGGKGGDWNRVVFTYKPAAETQSGSFKVDRNASLFNLEAGDTFPIQFDPAHPSRFYSDEAQSLSRTVFYVVLAVGAVFAAAVLVIDFSGR